MHTHRFKVGGKIQEQMEWCAHAVHTALKKMLARRQLVAPEGAAQAKKKECGIEELHAL